MPRKTRPDRQRSPARPPRPAPAAARPTSSSDEDSFARTYVPPLPTAHAICRVCGRIMRVTLPEEELPALQSFIDHRPDRWAVEGMSFSFTGLCPKCRVGPTL